MLLKKAEGIGGKGRQAPSAARKLVRLGGREAEVALRLQHLEDVEEDLALERRHLGMREVLKQ